MKKFINKKIKLVEKFKKKLKINKLNLYKYVNYII